MIELSFGIGMIAGPSLGGLLYSWDGFYLPFLVVGIASIISSLAYAAFFKASGEQSQSLIIIVIDLSDMNTKSQSTRAKRRTVSPFYPC